MCIDGDEVCTVYWENKLLNRHFVRIWSEFQGHYFHSSWNNCFYSPCRRLLSILRQRTQELFMKYSLVFDILNRGNSIAMNGVFSSTLIILYRLTLWFFAQKFHFNLSNSLFTISKDFSELKRHSIDNEIPIPHFENDIQQRNN